ncbi:hypothetical protein ABID39_000524 [Bartonella japonica]|uniref:Uncharacterized protein n=1 Tax=Bartonella japonica TaxID=357761 RepID=A0ABV2FMP8_9HYPH
MDRLNARAVETLGAGKYNDGYSFLLHKHKDGELNRFTVTFMSAVTK